jgi:hypothetical protein
MKKFLAACAFLALASPAIAATDALSGMSQHDLAGQSVIDARNQKIGTIEYMTQVNGRQAAVITVNGIGGTDEVALAASDLHTTGTGVTVAMSADQLSALPGYTPGQPYALR